MVLSVFLHMSRVFYHGAYKPPREFNWVVGVILLLADPVALLLGLPAPVGTSWRCGLSRWAPTWPDLSRWWVISQVPAPGWIEVSASTLLRFYVLHVLFFPFVIVIFLAVHFWRVRKDGGISGPL